MNSLPTFCTSEFSKNYSHSIFQIAHPWFFSRDIKKKTKHVFYIL
jgi:hypothetical protein